MSEATEKLNAEMTDADADARPLDAEARALVTLDAEAREVYEAVRGGGAAVFDLRERGRVEVAGAEAVQFLNGLVTNDVKALSDGRWMRAAFPNVQGRLIANARVLRTGDAFLFDTEPATRAALLKTLERFTLAGDFRVRDLTGETSCLSVQGARAADVVRETLGEEAAALARGQVFKSQGGGHSSDVGRRFTRTFTILRDTHTSEDGFDVIVGASDADALLAELTRAGALRAVGEASEVLRVEAGVPVYGKDVDESSVVLEAVAEEAVSFTKGCYVGQEIIARIHWRGHVAKKLAGLVFEGDARPATPARLLAGEADREAGRVTSAVFSPRLGRAVALAVVKYEFLKAGTRLRIASGEGEEALAARVAELPLVRGSWYEGEATSEASDDAGASL
ncbi:MAG TPA: glycine cleavage T C-terminal barrel domain-containing protein [Pyrinomonadaceae bacterium]|nr:glycine cleavage T C-terminal barrel domain-containing protein [Pyrinomonadaceae bacterium]